MRPDFEKLYQKAMHTVTSLADQIHVLSVKVDELTMEIMRLQDERKETVEPDSKC